MSNLEQKVKNAFDGVQMPEGLEDATMAYVMGHLEADAQPTKASPVRRPKIIAMRGFRVAAACMLTFVLCAGGVGTYAAYATETASATVQADSDVRLGVNRFGRVLSVEISNSSIDEESKSAIESVCGMQFEDALDKLLQEEALAPSVESGNVEVQIACNDSTQESTMKQQCQECMGKHVRARNGSGDGAGNSVTNDETNKGHGRGQENGGSHHGNGGNGNGGGHGNC